MAAASAHPPSSLNQADVAGAISSFYGVSSADAAVAKLLAVIFPDVASAASRDPGSWKSVFPGVLAKYESLAKDLGLGVSQQQREIDAARNANPTAAGSKGTEFAQHGARFLSNVPLAMRDDGKGGERASSAAITRDAPLSVNGAISYAREIGANPALAGFFVGGSAEMRDALRSAIHNGTAIADDKIKSMNDVGMVIGAIRAGKLKPDDPRIPDSVKKIIGAMKDKGIDPRTADQKTIRKYLNENPDALNKARQQGLVDEQRNKQFSQSGLSAKVEGAKDVAAPSKKGAPKNRPVAATTTL